MHLLSRTRGYEVVVFPKPLHDSLVMAFCTSQALLNDFDYSDEDEDREGMRGQGQKGMQQPHEASMPVEG